MNRGVMAGMAAMEEEAPPPEGPVCTGHSLEVGTGLVWTITQGVVDVSASEPALVQDTNYMVEKTYHIAPYLGAFEAYLMPQ